MSRHTDERTRGLATPRPAARDAAVYTEGALRDGAGRKRRRSAAQLRAHEDPGAARSSSSSQSPPEGRPASAVADYAPGPGAAGWHDAYAGRAEAAGPAPGAGTAGAGFASTGDRASQRKRRKLNTAAPLTAQEEGQQRLARVREMHAAGLRVPVDEHQSTQEPLLLSLDWPNRAPGPGVIHSRRRRQQQQSTVRAAGRAADQRGGERSASARPGAARWTHNAAHTAAGAAAGASGPAADQAGGLDPSVRAYIDGRILDDFFPFGVGAPEPDAAAAPRNYLHDGVASHAFPTAPAWQWPPDVAQPRAGQPPLGDWPPALARHAGQNEARRGQESRHPPALQPHPHGRLDRLSQHDLLDQLDQLDQLEQLDRLEQRYYAQDQRDQLQQHEHQQHQHQHQYDQHDQHEHEQHEHEQHEHEHEQHQHERRRAHRRHRRGGPVERHIFVHHQHTHFAAVPLEPRLPAETHRAGEPRAFPTPTLQPQTQQVPLLRQPGRARTATPPETPPPSHASPYSSAGISEESLLATIMAEDAAMATAVAGGGQVSQSFRFVYFLQDHFVDPLPPPPPIMSGMTPFWAPSAGRYGAQSGGGASDREQREFLETQTRSLYDHTAAGPQAGLRADVLPPLPKTRPPAGYASAPPSGELVADSVVCEGCAAGLMAAETPWFVRRCGHVYCQSCARDMLTCRAAHCQDRCFTRQGLFTELFI